MPVDLQTPRPAQELTEEFAIKGGLKLLLDEVMVPVRIIGDRPRKLVSGQFNLAAAVGFRSEIALVNPIAPEASLDTTLQVHRMYIRSGSATNIEVAWPTANLTGLTTITTTRFLDNRRSGAPRAAFQQDNTAAATAAVVFARHDVAASAPSVLVEFDPHPIIIAPLFFRSLLIRPAVANQSITLVLVWSEPADPV